MHAGANRRKQRQTDEANDKGCRNTKESGGEQLIMGGRGWAYLGVKTYLYNILHVCLLAGFTKPNPIADLQGVSRGKENSYFEGTVKLGANDGASV